MKQESTHQIEGQLVSEYAYITYQFWRKEKSKMLFLFLIFLLNSSVVIAGGLLIANVFILQQTQCEQSNGSTP